MLKADADNFMQILETPLVMSRTVGLLIFIFYATFSFSQNCGTVEKNILNVPDTAFERKLLLPGHWELMAGHRTPTHVIPVVFHVVHNGGEENVSDSAIYICLRGLNAPFFNEFKSAVFPRFRDLSTDTKIEFRLSSIDPDGNPTTGITTTKNIASEDGDEKLFHVMHWPKEQYMNVYISKRADGNSGYAY